MMKCRNCKRNFGLDLELGFENEKIGNCSICLKDVCASCGFIPGIQTHEVIDPVVICSGCIRQLSEASKEAVA